MKTLYSHVLKDIHVMKIVVTFFSGAQSIIGCYIKREHGLNANFLIINEKYNNIKHQMALKKSTKF